MSARCDSFCFLLEKPPSRSNNGIIQIIELIIMAILAFLAIYDGFIHLYNNFSVLTILGIIMDICIIIGLFLIIFGLFFGGDNQKIGIGIYCLTTGIINAVVFFIYSFYEEGTIGIFLTNLTKGIILIFLVYLLSKQMNNI